MSVKRDKTFYFPVVIPRKNSSESLTRRQLLYQSLKRVKPDLSEILGIAVVGKTVFE